MQFYIGDWLKDTRTLPLNCRGAWIDLIAFMWNNDPKGEISGTDEEFARILGCTTREWKGIFEVLTARKVMDFREENGQKTLISRKIKRMDYISAIRSESGLKGAKAAHLPPDLPRQNGWQKPDSGPGPDNEYEYEDEDKGGEGGKRNNFKEGDNRFGKFEFTPPEKREVLYALTEEMRIPHAAAEKIAENFMEYYLARDWMMGRTKMGNWRAALRLSLKWDENQITGNTVRKEGSGLKRPGT